MKIQEEKHDTNRSQQRKRTGIRTGHHFLPNQGGGLGLTILAIAIVIAGVLVSNAIERAGNEVAGQIAGAIRLLS